jgi:hypothetical protein
MGLRAGLDVLEKKFSDFWHIFFYALCDSIITPSACFLLLVTEMAMRSRRQNSSVACRTRS